MITRIKLPLYYCYCILFQISSVHKAVLNVKTMYNVLDPMTYVILMTIVTITLTRMKICVKVKFYNRTYISSSEHTTSGINSTRIITDWKTKQSKGMW